MALRRKEERSDRCTYHHARSIVQQPLEAFPLRLIARKARPDKAGIHVGLGVLLNEICYNPPAKYKVLANGSRLLANGSAYWPTGWTW